MGLTWQHLGGMTAAALFFVIIAIISGRKVRSAADFSLTGRRAGATLVAGTIMGTLVGGASTVGTVQLAYMCGLSAWWFTLGGGLACLLIALCLAKPMQETHFETVPQFISSGYGATAGVLAAVFVSLGMFINVVPQIFSVTALLQPLFPLEANRAALIAVVMMVGYVIFGGLWGTGLMGMGKVILTTLSLCGGGALALHLLGGPAGPATHFDPHPWFNLFGRGVGTDLAAAFSLLVGVLSSQIYFQAILSGRNLAAARGGALISALLCPLIGAGGILIGLYMRAYYPDILPAQALPLFIMERLPPPAAGVILATLILVSVGTGAGLTLGISTMLNRDVCRFFRPGLTDRQSLSISRLLIVAVAAAAYGVAYYSGGDAVILQWSYLSLGLRGATICFPLLAVIFFKERISPRGGAAAVLLGPLTVIATGLLPLKLNPLYPGLTVSFAVLAIDYARSNRTNLGEGSCS